MTDLEVSVVLAVRNDAAGLETAASSILGQREVSLELVVVDDGSTDDTPAALRSLEQADSRVRTVRVEHGGLTRALIAGCDRARAPVIARQDAGDWSAPERLVRQLEVLRQNAEVTFVSCWTRTLGPEGEPLQVIEGGISNGAPVELDPSDERSEELVGPTSHGSVMFRKSSYEAVRGYRSEFVLAQDWDLWWRLSEIGRCAGVPEVLYTRTLHARSLSLRLDVVQRRFGRLAREAAIARRRQREEEPMLLQARELAARLRRPMGSTGSEARGLYFIGSLLRSRGDARARGYFQRAAMRNPLLARAWVRWIQSWL